MIFQIAFIFVAMGIFITLFAVLEILFLDIIIQQGAKEKRSRNVRNTFDK
jgi:lipopolysaccharide export LptBFGC system permease protein LptF